MKSKLLILIILLSLYTSKNNAEYKIKLYALYTPSHKILADKFFLPTIQDDFELIIVKVDQTCPTAQFLERGWRQTTIQKVDLIIQAVKDNWGKVFIFSDVDIQFFGPIQQHILSLMQDNDLIIQKNSPNGVICSGFFACRGNEKTLRLWQDVRKVMVRTRLSDQRSLNRCLRKQKRRGNLYGIKWNYLPPIFFGGGALTGKRWHPGTKLLVPQGVVMHHANWTIGIKNKIKQLKYVQGVVWKRKKLIC